MNHESRVETTIRYIFPLTGVLPPNREEVGGKGYHLQRLLAGNFHVPGGFVVTTAAFREVLESILEKNPPLEVEGLYRCFMEAEIPGPIADEILKSASLLTGLTGGALVVRSSATLEDSESRSMAGQNATFVNVRSREGLLQAVKGCWASLFTTESVGYRSLIPHDAARTAMAVVVQQLVPSFRAGVLFTMDPVLSDPDRMVLNANWGLGETVVSGKAADTVVLDRETGEILEHQVARKTDKLVPMEDGKTRSVPIGNREANRPVLDEVLARRLWELGKRVERFFGVPQDLEWAEWDHRIYLVQTRPITGGRTSRSVWTNANVGEALPGVATPHTWSVIHSFSRQGLLHAFRGLGCRVPEGYAIVGSIRGRIYLNISEFMSVASQIPFLTPQILMEVAGGGGVEELAGTYESLGHGRFLALLPATVSKLVLSRMVSSSRVALWAQHFKRFRDRFDGVDLARLSRSELAALQRETEEVFGNTGALLMECSGQFLADYLATTIVLNYLLKGEGELLERELFSGLSGIPSAEPGLDLLRMARRVTASPLLKKLVLETPPGELQERLAQNGREAEGLAMALEAFLTSHGHRAEREAELSEPRWREDPTFPLTMLRKYVESGRLADPEALLAARVEARAEATRKVLELVPRRWRSVVGRLLANSQRGARTREDLRSFVVHNIGFYRKLALETGRRLVEEGRLSAVEEAFFLTREEHLEYLQTGKASDFRVPATLRRVEHQALLTLPDPPDHLVTEGGRIVTTSPPPVQGWVLNGLAGSPGIATGKAVIARCAADAQKVQPGDILVAPFTDVGWTPVFLVAGAVVTELGGPLSHSCVVAREYGVPAVVNVKGATRLLQEGRQITVDGNKGKVIVEAGEDEPVVLG